MWYKASCIQFSVGKPSLALAQDQDANYEVHGYFWTKEDETVLRGWAWFRFAWTFSWTILRSVGKGLNFSKEKIVFWQDINFRVAFVCWFVCHLLLLSESLWRWHFRTIQAAFQAHNTKRKVIKLRGGRGCCLTSEDLQSGCVHFSIPSLSSFIKHFSAGTEHLTGYLSQGTKAEIRNDVKQFPLTLRHRWRLHSHHIVCLSGVPKAINYHNDGSQVIYFFWVSWCFRCITSRHCIFQQSFVLEISRNHLPLRMASTRSRCKDNRPSANGKGTGELVKVTSSYAQNGKMLFSQTFQICLGPD